MKLTPKQEKLIENKLRKLILESTDSLIYPEIKKIAKMTDQNDHIGALIKLAELLKNNKALKVLAGIKMIQDAEGYLPSEISTYRYGWYTQLMSECKSKFNPDVYKKIHNSF